MEDYLYSFNLLIKIITSNKSYHLKKLLGVFLILLIFLNSAGFVILFFQADSGNRIEMRERISTHNYANDLNIITIDKKNINLLIRKNENEFEYRGKMYDVIKAENTNNLIILYCLIDKEENNLNNYLHGLLDENRDKHHQNSQRNMNHIVISPVIIKGRYIINRTDEIYSFSPNAILNYKSITLNLLTPPPKDIS
jgi:hypothetical protein